MHQAGLRALLTKPSAVAFAGLIGLGVSGTAVADGSTDTATANATLTVLEAISVSTTQDMDFGEVYTGDSTAVTAPTPAQFSVSGEGSAGYDVSVDNSVSLSDGSGNTVSASLTPSATSGTLDSSGADSFTVDGEIASGDIPTTAGTYQGSFTATVSYTN